MRRRRHTANRPHKRLALIGRWLVIVSLWHAPLPMAHAHGADIADSADTTAFVEHLTKFHTDVTLNSHVDFGWHWHLVPPIENHPGTDGPDGQHPCCPFDCGDTLLMAQSSVGSVDMIVLASVPSWLTSVLPTVGIGVCRDSAAPTTFLETYLGSVSLRTLLRVARC